jgi:hypothetical protein
MANFESRSTSFPDVRSRLSKWRRVVRFAAKPTAASSFDRFFDGFVKKACTAVILLILLGIARTAHAQISPGPLARPHHDLEGPANCTKCHTQSVSERSFRCTECHREIAAELQQHRGLHSTFPNEGRPGEACVKCHSDHNGENFAMLHWDPTPKGFDHTKTGFALDGKHVGVTCRSCHQAKNVSASARGLLQEKDLSHSYFGLSAQCVTCHEDKHQGRFGTTCTQCHNTTDWKDTKVEEKSFDHSTTHYPLTGLHRTVSCEKCHTAGADGRPRYTGLQFDTCTSCHADPHKGEFKQDCASCHTTATWKKSGFQTTFDHSTTAFPLLGKHTEVSCIDCHKTANFKAPIAYKLCSDCHKPDPHSGQFAKRADGGKCESCHTVQGWKPTTFTAVEHARTQFALVSPHDKVECAKCHIPAGQKTIYKVAFAHCLDCHKDEHNGQFAAAPWENRCEKCHNGATWKVANYTIAVHQKGTYPLTGAHMAVACNDCHKPMLGSPVALYHFKSVACTTCHEDIHHGEFAERMAMLSPDRKPMGCEACHQTKDWHDMTRFDHGTTKFALDGSHRAVQCMDCHKPPNMERNMIHVNFADAPVACNECHENPHADQFGERALKCAECHNTNKWKPSLFDHEKTEFSLKGGHQNVACGACHQLKREVNGEDVLFYKPTPKACEACHSNGVPKQTTPGSL